MICVSDLFSILQFFNTPPIEHNGLSHMNNARHRINLITCWVVSVCSPLVFAEPRPHEATTHVANPVELPDVTVKAQKRDQSIQDVPLSVTALTKDTLQQAMVDDITSLSDEVSSLQILNQGSIFNTKVFLRGLGTSATDLGLESSVGFFVDDVYQNRIAGVMNNLYDIEQVEVMRGPQASLFGKNTSAGVISIRSRLPSFSPEYHASLGFGSFDERSLFMTATGPLSERSAYRVSLNQQRRDGFYDNSFDGRDLNDRNRGAIRGQFLYEPNSDFNLLLKIEHDQMDERCCVSVFYRHQPYNAAFLNLLGAKPIETDPYSGNVSNDSPPSYEHDQTRFLMRADWNRSWGTISSISSYQWFQSKAKADLDGTDLEILSPESANSDQIGVFSQELRWTSVPKKPLQWIGGLFYLNQGMDLRQSYRYGSSMRPYMDVATTALVGGTPLVDPSPIDTLEAFTVVPAKTFFTADHGLQRADYDLKSDSLSLYGQADWALSERLTLGTGLRWTYEKKRIHSSYQINDPFAALDLSPGGAIAAINPAFITLSGLQFFKPVPDQDLSRIEKYLSGGLSLSYLANELTEAYVSYRRGYKSGGFQVTSFFSDGGIEFDRELVDAFELGLKLQDRDHGWQVNLAAFYQQVDGYQVFVIENNTAVVRNASDVIIQGVEMEALWQLGSNWLLEQNTTYLDATFRAFDNAPCPFGAATAPCSLSGRSIQSIPDWSTSTTLLHQGEWLGLSVLSRLQHVYTGSRFVAVNHDPDSKQDSVHLLNASVLLSIPGESWTIRVWGKNLTNEHYTESMVNSVVLVGDLTGIPSDPRTIGVTVSMTLD